MSNATVALQGNPNNAGAEFDLFLSLFTGEVLTAFSKKTIMEGRIRTRAITNGRTAVFANTGRATGAFHVPGAEILGQDMLHNETTISVDHLLISSVFIAELYDAMNHFEVRGEYSKQLGEALARTRDKTSMRVVAQSARSSNKITGLPGGTSVVLDAGYAADTDANKAVALAAAIRETARTFEENDVPLDGVTCAVKPVDYYRLIENKDLLNRDWGGSGSYTSVDVPPIAGIPIVSTNMLPQQDDSLNALGSHYEDGGDIINAKYGDDYSKVQALIWTPEAAGEVSLIDFSVQSDYDIRRQGTLMVARRATGLGTLRPECAAEIVIP